MEQVSKLDAIRLGKCPRCRKGDVFKHSVFRFQNFAEMHLDCPHCQLHYEVEPGFFWLAMYVSYGFMVGIFIVSFFTTKFLYTGNEIWVYVVSALIPIFLSIPISFRYSRILVLHWFSGVSYSSEYK